MRKETILLMGKDWVDYVTFGVTGLASIATAIAAFQAKRSADISANQFKEQTAQHYKANRPRLIPSNTLLKTKIPYVLADWDTSPEDSSISITDQSLSRFSVPLINISSHFATDIYYKFELFGGTNSITEYQNDTNDIRISFQDNSVRQLEDQAFSFSLFSTNNPILDERNTNIIVGSISNALSMVKPNEEANLYLPHYFVILNNIFFDSYGMENQNRFPRPKLVLDISYKDQYFNSISEKYHVQVSTNQIVSRHDPDPNVEARIVFELLS